MEHLATHRARRVRAWVLAVLVVVIAAVAVTVVAQSSDLERTLKNHGTVLSYVFVVSLVLIFLLGYGIRDGLQKRGQRIARADEPEGIPRRE